MGFFIPEDGEFRGLDINGLREKVPFSGCTASMQGFIRLGGKVAK